MARLPSDVDLRVAEYAMRSITDTNWKVNVPGPFFIDPIRGRGAGARLVLVGSRACAEPARSPRSSPALVLPTQTGSLGRSLPDFAGTRVPLRPAPHPQIGSSPNRSVQ